MSVLEAPVTRRWARDPRAGRRPALFLVGALAVLALATSSAAQDAAPGANPAVDATSAPVQTGAATLSGRLQDSEGRPVPSWPVGLHRVNDAGGALLASATTDGEGRFAFQFQPDVPGIYFVATRYEGQLYVGTPFQPPDLPTGEYRVIVGEGGNLIPGAGEVALGPAEPPPARLPVAGLVFLVAVAGAFALAYRGGRVRSDWRALALELAQLEEAHAVQRAAAPAEREAYRRRRAELWDRLKRTAGV